MNRDGSQRAASFHDRRPERSRRDPGITNERWLNFQEHFPKKLARNHLPFKHGIHVGQIADMPALNLGQRLGIKVIVKKIDRPMPGDKKTAAFPSR